MADRPILMSATMVRALLSGKKTQTRRAIKRQPHDGVRILVERYNPTVIDRHGEEQPGPEIYGAYSEDGEWGCKCPYGQPLDRLWVRETFSDDWTDLGWPVQYRADGGLPTDMIDAGVKWQPSIFMPRAHSRITLEVTGVRVERLQEITAPDAIAEGVEKLDPRTSDVTLIGQYRQIWTAINGPASWNANPWVWVICFRSVTTG